MPYTPVNVWALACLRAQNIHQNLFARVWVSHNQQNFPVNIFTEIKHGIGMAVRECELETDYFY